MHVTLKVLWVVNYYAVVFLRRPSDLLRCEPFFERRDAGKTQGHWCPHNGIAIANHCAIVHLLRVAIFYGVVFLVRQGSFLKGTWNDSSHEATQNLMHTLQRKPKGQRLKGNIVSALFHTFKVFFSHFHTFSHLFSPRIFLKIKACFKENKKKKTKPFCTLVVACLFNLMHILQRLCSF